MSRDTRKSSLVACPICNKPTPEWYINDHIDNNCSGVPDPHQHLSTPASSAGVAQTVTTPSRKTTLSFVPLTKRKSGQLFVDEDAKLEDAIHTNNYHNEANANNGLSTRPPGKRQKISESIAQAMPLAERVRPTDFESFVGQEELMGPKGLLRKLICNDRIPSMILWGPPGSGKTTAARMIAQTTRSRFVEMGGVTHATADVKRAFEDAWSLLTLTGQRTILFLDEIHRFNKAQQDLFLPYVERGTIVLVGATTENPSFKVNAALLSRCRVFVLERIGEEEMVRILKRAVQVWRGEKGVEDESGGVEGERGAGKEGENEVQGTMTKNKKVDDETRALRQLALVSDGDARNALNILDLALTALSDPTQRLSHEDLRGAFQKSHLLYDRVGEEHYNAISALHKSIRGSDADAALYWLARMLEAGEDPLYVARRLIRCASEDIGLADNQALPLAVSTFQACQFIGMPECEVILAQCVIYLAEARKSVRAYKAYGLAKQTVQEEPAYPVPLHIRNAPTGLMKTLGYGAGYKYNPDYEGPVEQEYLPPELKRRRFLDVGIGSAEVGEISGRWLDDAKEEQGRG